MKWDEFTEQCKNYEREGLTNYEKGKPILLRLDGRAFHTYTRGLKRPYDDRLSTCMMETTKTLINNFDAKIGYTQSDEITLLLWADPKLPSSCLPFDARYDKLISVSAGLASSTFASQAYQRIPEKRHFTPHFDCRVWCVPTQEEAVNVFVWRQADAIKNSITMAAQSVYSHKQLLNQGSKKKLEMLHEKGIDWNDYPNFFKCGSFFQRKNFEGLLSQESLAKIPEQHRPQSDELVIRSKVVEVEPLKLSWNFLIGK